MASPEQRASWLRLGVVPDDYDGPVAADYLSCIERVERLVLPHRATVNRDKYRLKWWQFAEPCLNMYRAIAPLDKCIVRAQVSQTWAFGFTDIEQVLDAKLIIFATCDLAHFAILQSSIHFIWADTYKTTMRTDFTYTPERQFQTFPFPVLTEHMRTAGLKLIELRQRLCRESGGGFTELSKKADDPMCEHSGVLEFRACITQLDRTVVEAYGWQDLDLAHDFYGEGRDCRFTISVAARNEILRRLLRLNHERYAAEVAAGLHDKGNGKPKASKPKTAVSDLLSGPRRSLFDDQPLLGEDGPK